VLLSLAPYQVQNGLLHLIVISEEVEKHFAESFRHLFGVGHPSSPFVWAILGGREGNRPAALDVEPADCPDTSPDVGMEEALDAGQ
jgi:hypothetical protein